MRLIVLECMILGICAYPAWTDGEAVTLAADETQSTAADASSTYWYGAPMLLMDGISTAAVVTILVTQSGKDVSTTAATSLMLGSTAGLMGGPTVHAIHGNWGKAGASFLLRATSLGLLYGALLSQEDFCFDCTESEVPVGPLIFGMVAVIGSQLLDDLSIAREPEARHSRLTPQIRLDPDHVGLALRYRR